MTKRKAISIALHEKRQKRLNQVFRDDLWNCDKTICRFIRAQLMAFLKENERRQKLSLSVPVRQAMLIRRVIAGITMYLEDEYGPEHARRAFRTLGRVIPHLWN